MVLTCSPQREGNTLHFASPARLHHLDATSTLLQLRRSLSRSPSKSPAFRLVSGKPTKSTNAPLSPSPLSHHRTVSRIQSQATSLNGSGVKAASAPSPLGSDIPPSARATRPHLRKYSPLRQGQRTYGQARPYSSKRALGESSDAGNAAPTFGLSTSSGLENFCDAMDTSNSVVQPPKPKFKGFVDDGDVAAAPAASMTGMDALQSPGPQPPQSPFSFRNERHSLRLADIPVKSSPLKRTDAPSRMDPMGETSPSAKRRSLNGSSDFNIFEHFDVTEVAVAGPASPEPVRADDVAPAQSVIARRMGSLRKSTIQQRHDRPSLNRLTADFYGNQSPSGASTRKASETTRPTLPTRRNLFASEQSAAITSGLNNDTTVEPPQAPTRHPLSRTVTQSSSGDERAQDSPTHVPMRAPPNRRPIIGAFAKSLPLGVERQGTSLASSSVAVPKNQGVETPADYRSAKPLQAVFNSTGLVSKRMKDLRHETKSPVNIMPDTPCKRPMPANPMAPSATPAPPPRHAQLKQHVHAFGAPSTPFNASASRPTPVANGQGVGIFGSAMRPLNRRGSFISVESDDNVDNTPGQSFDLPATPSKTAGMHTNSHLLSGSSLQPRAEETDVGRNDRDAVFGSQKPMPQCKFFLSSPDDDGEDGDDDAQDISGDDKMDESPSAPRQFASLGATSSSAHRRPSVLHGSPSGGTRKALTLPHIRTGDLHAKRSSLSPASPLFERPEQGSPHTPKDVKDFIAPPDPSGLSISAQNVQSDNFQQSGFARNLAASIRPPATPTANRESSRFESHRLVQSSAHAIAEAKLDPSLMSRFDEIEMIGDGEFSAVFKVTKHAENVKRETGGPFHKTSFSTQSTSSSQTAKPVRVYAVKKSRTAYLGQKDRANKLQEAEILRALGRSEHVVEFLDHWEFESHLYIQTEFCEEGSLDKFLEEAGRSTRLDDFRVWKILYESTLGLGHIHHSGFMHLDLKPANILISSNGTLKIADFGLAAPWPAAPGLEAEGDREYIAPEVLVGKVDKPSDVFALGLIMVEIAGNVVLPDNGPIWRRLREGNLSDIPPLTAMTAAAVERDDSGIPVIDKDPHLISASAPTEPGSETLEKRLPRLLSPPPFMMDSQHASSLDQVVKRMIDPTTTRRPTVNELLQSAGLSWVADRRQAPATIFEGEWGPLASSHYTEMDNAEIEDAEMMDV